MDKFAETYKKLLTEEISKEEKFEEFLNKRKTGAEKIAKASEKKGGYSVLTAIHFAAKEQPYKEAEKKANDPDKNSFYKEKVKELYTRLKDIDSLSQREFQSLMGQLEVWGEVYIRSTKPNSLKIVIKESSEEDKHEVEKIIDAYETGQENWSFDDMVDEIKWYAIDHANYALEDAATTYQNRTHSSRIAYGGRGKGNANKIERDFLRDVKSILAKQ